MHAVIKNDIWFYRALKQSADRAWYCATWTLCSVCCTRLLPASEGLPSESNCVTICLQGGEGGKNSSSVNLIIPPVCSEFKVLSFWNRLLGWKWRCQPSSLIMALNLTTKSEACLYKFNEHGCGLLKILWNTLLIPREYFQSSILL